MYSRSKFPRKTRTLWLVFYLVLVFSSANGQFHLLYEKWSTISEDNFGFSVDGVGDLNNDGFSDFIVGIPYAEANNNTNVGRAVVYSGKDGSVIYQKNGEYATNYFGWAVAGAGDINRDGTPDFIIGAPGYDYNNGQEFIKDGGKVYVYSGANGSQLQFAVGLVYGENMGYSVDGVGDVGTDGYGDFIVGSPYRYINPVTGDWSGGAAFVYSGAGFFSVIRQVDGVPGDRLGWSVAGIGDVNGDGKSDYIVGAPGADDGADSDAGEAHVFSGWGGTLIYTKAGVSENDYFGVSVSGVGDINGDGRADFIVGAEGTNANGPNSGSAYVFSGATGTVIAQENGVGANDGFGSYVSGGGDMNGDGHPDFIVAAHLADPNGLVDAGSVYVYSGVDTSLILQKNGSSPGDDFGRCVSGGSDVSGDGRGDLIVGAPLTDYASNSGSAFVYGNDIPRVLVVVPNGGEAWENGAFRTIRWTATDRDGIASVEVKLDRNGDGTFEEPIASLPGNSTSYSWQVSGSYAPTAKIQVSARDASPFNNLGSDASDNAFSILTVFPIIYQKQGVFYGDVDGGGDVNGDGKPDFIIGKSDSAFVYSGATGNLIHQVATSNDFGFYSVAIIGDCNGDNKADFATGVPYTAPH